MSKNEEKSDAKLAYSLLLNLSHIYRKTSDDIIRKNSYGEECRVDKVFKSTNESSIDYMTDVISKDSSILSVAGSGDQYLNSVLYGAKEVDLFDINVLTYYHNVLKIVSASVLPLSEYKQFLLSDRIDKNGYTFMDKRFYDKVSSYLPSNVRNYYDEFYYLSESSKINYPFDYIFHDGNNTELICRCPYIDKLDYYRLQRLLQERKLPNFILGDIVNILPRLRKKYDGMILSNIIDYTYENLETVVYKDGLPHLNDNGTIQLAYIWGNIEHSEYRDIDFDELGISIKRILVNDTRYGKSEDNVLFMKKKL